VTLDCLGSVRRAGPEDEDKIFALLVEMHRHNRSGWGFPYNPNLVMTRIEAGTRPDPTTRRYPSLHNGLIGVVDGDTDIVASIGLFVEPSTWFTEASCLREIWVYVRPSERAAALYEELFRFGLEAHRHMQEELRGKGYPLPFPYQTGVMNDAGKIEVMERLWRKASGAEKVGVLFMKR
jgi:hypothetical protein